MKRTNSTDEENGGFTNKKKLNPVTSMDIKLWMKVFSYLDEISSLRFLSCCKTFYDFSLNEQLFLEKLEELGYEKDCTKGIADFDKYTRVNFEFYVLILKRKQKMNKLVNTLLKYFKNKSPPLEKSKLQMIIKEKKKFGIVFPIDLIFLLQITGGFSDDIYCNTSAHINFDLNNIEKPQDNNTVYKMEYDEMIQDFDKIAEWHYASIEAKSERFISLGNQSLDSRQDSEDEFFIICDPDSKYFGHFTMFIYTYLGTIVKTKTLLELFEKMEGFLKIKPDKELFEFIQTFPFIISTTALISTDFS